MTRAEAGMLERLFATLETRRGADPGQSYTAKLLASGPSRAARKLGEEAIETVIAAAEGERQAVIAESADLLYHLLVLWLTLGIAPQDVAAVLAAREGKSGLQEKAARDNQS